MRFPSGPFAAEAQGEEHPLGMRGDAGAMPVSGSALGEALSGVAPSCRKAVCIAEVALLCGRYAGVADWLGSRLPPWPSEFDSRRPLRSNALHEYISTCALVRNSSSTELERSFWEGRRLQPDERRVRFALAPCSGSSVDRAAAF